MQALSNLADPGAVRALLDRLVTTGVLPGASILVVQDGREVLFHACGLQDLEAATSLRRDTLFRLYSMTKPVVAAAVMILVDGGVLRLDDPVTDYIPEFKALRVHLGRDGDRVRSTPARQMLVKHLLTHEAGISAWFHAGQPVSALFAADPGIGLEERWRFDPAMGGLAGLARALARLPLVAQPGERWHYGMALDAAGVLIERATGEPLDRFLAGALFQPLGMHDTGFSVEPSAAERLASLYGAGSGGGLLRLEDGRKSPLLKPVATPSGGGGLVSSIDDYARFAEMLRRGGELGGRRVLSEAAVRAMMTNQLRPDQLGELPELARWGLGGAGEGMGFGFGGAVLVDPPASVPAFRGEYSWGGGASTTFWVDPVNRLSVVFMTQLFPPSSEMLRDRLHGAIYAAGASGTPEPTVRGADAPPGQGLPPPSTNSSQG